MCFGQYQASSATLGWCYMACSQDHHPLTKIYFWLYAVLMIAVIVCEDQLFRGWDSIVLWIHGY